jgi:hypothetical protein
MSLGLPRTGTTSLTEAFSYLQDFNLFFNGEYLSLNCTQKDLDFWTKALDGEKVDYKEYFKNYALILDLPVILFYKDIILQMPDVKIIYTKRTFELWYNSISKYFELIDKYLNMVNLTNEPFFILMHRVRNFKFFNNMSLEEISKDKNKAKEFYYKWYTNLLKYYRVGNWESLCKLLDKKIPDIPYPHLNSLKSHLENFDKIKK